MQNISAWSCHTSPWTGSCGRGAKYRRPPWSGYWWREKHSILPTRSHFVLSSLVRLDHWKARQHTVCRTGHESSVVLTDHLHLGGAAGVGRFLPRSCLHCVTTPAWGPWQRKRVCSCRWGPHFHKRPFRRSSADPGSGHLSSLSLELKTSGPALKA